MDNSKARLVMLAFSGLLFGASGLGWYLHAESRKQPEPAPPVVAASPAVTGDSIPLPEPRPNVYTATRYEDAVRAARESIRREPVAPLAHHRVSPANQTVPPPPRAPKLLDPPAVYTPGLQQLGEQQPQQSPIFEEPRHNKLTVKDVRLVGLIDGKAIFRIRRDVAHDLGMAPAFTLGKGESFNNIRVEKVDTEKATVGDGRSLATIELSRVH